jgi:hypothetical protein
MPKIVDYNSVEGQRELSSGKTAQAQGISGRHTVTHQGQTVVFGDYDPGKAAGRARDPEFETVLVSMKARHAKTGIQPACVINMLPLALVVNSPMHSIGGVRVPPCLGAHLDFTAHVWHECSIEVRYIGEGVNQPWDFLPIQLAEAFEMEYYATGGVVALIGEPTEENMRKPENAQKIADCLERMYVWMMGKIVEANGFWNSPNHGAAAAIVEVHRVCATRMFEIGKIPQLPEWIQPVTEQSAIDAKCPTCGVIPATEAVKCVSCNEILDPGTAFLKGVISEEHESLERLTREQVIELGVSAFVAETADERPARLAQGLRKPMSIANARALQEQEEADAKAEEAREKKAEAKAKKAEVDAAKAAESKK